MEPVLGCCVPPLSSPIPTGDLLRITHLARGADASGTLLLDSVLSGSVPESIGKATLLLQVPELPTLPARAWLLGWVPRGSPRGLQPDSPLLLPPQDFSERYVRTGAGRFSGDSVQSFLQDGRLARARCNHTIEYEPAPGLQPLRVQHIQAREVQASFDPASEELSFQLSTSLDAGNQGDENGEEGAGIPHGSWVAGRAQRLLPFGDTSLLSHLCLLPRRPVPTRICSGPSAAALPWYGPSLGQGLRDGLGLEGPHGV